jgi:hypothetical protein
MNRLLNPPTRLLRNKATRLWYKQNGGWTTRMEEALNFPSAESTVVECEKNQLKDVQLVLVVNGTVFSVGIDIHAGEHAQPAQV